MPVIYWIKPSKAPTYYDQLSQLGYLTPRVASYVAGIALDYDRPRLQYEQLEAVQIHYVDGFLVETKSKITERSVAIDALVSANQPARIGVTVENDSSNRLRYGRLLSAAIEILDGGSLDSVMIYCSQLETIAKLRPSGIVQDLEYHGELDAEACTAHVLKWLHLGATIVGGCCEITPAHIQHSQQAYLI